MNQWSEGDRIAAGEVITFLYQEIHRLASSCFQQERPDHTLQPTALVHELYLSMVEQTGIRFQNREHFIGLAAHMMRRILVEHARRRGRVKRGSRLQRVPLENLAAAGPETPQDLLALEDALQGLAKVDPRKEKLVELRFFGGLSLPDAARQLGISRATAVREWRRTRAWLFSELAHGEGREEGSGEKREAMSGASPT